MKNSEAESQVSDSEQNSEQLATIEPGNLTSEQVQQLKERALKAEENWERLLRTTADFDNFKKRAAREKQDALRYANESLLEELVPVLDNFDMALAATQTSNADTAQSLQTGVSMIFQQL